MILKSLLRSTIGEVFEEFEVENSDLKTELVDRLIQEFGDEVYDDEEDEDESALSE